MAKGLNTWVGQARFSELGKYSTETPVDMTTVTAHGNYVANVQKD